MADIVNRIPFELSNFGTSGGGSYNLQDYRFDYALGGIPFMSGFGRVDLTRHSLLVCKERESQLLAILVEDTGALAQIVGCAGGDHAPAYAAARAQAC